MKKLSDSILIVLWNRPSSGLSFGLSIEVTESVNHQRAVGSSVSLGLLTAASQVRSALMHHLHKLMYTKHLK